MMNPMRRRRCQQKNKEPDGGQSQAPASLKEILFHGPKIIYQRCWPKAMLVFFQSVNSLRVEALELPRSSIVDSKTMNSAAAVKTMVAAEEMSK
jgi:hypothetical protein